MEIAGAVLLGLLSIILSVSIAGALFNGSGILFELGSFFIDSLGALSFGVPAYLFYAAFLLVSPSYRPDRIFVMSCSLIPFLTLAIGFVFMRDFDYWSQRFDFFHWVGKGGFNFFVILLTIIEGLLITAFTALFFPRAPAAAALVEAPNRTGAQENAPPPDGTIGERLWPSFRTPESRRASSAPPPLRDIRAEGGEEIDIASIRLPDLKPLATATVLRELECLSATGAVTPERGGEPPDQKKPAYEYEEELDLVVEGEAPQGSAGEPPPSFWRAYRIPIEGILNQYSEHQYWIIDQATKDAALILRETLREFNIPAEVMGIRKGPAITLFEIQAAPDVKLSKIVNIQDNIALRLAAASMRVIAPLPGKHAVGIEVPNAKRTIVSFTEIIEAELKGTSGRKPEIPVILGKDITGSARVKDLAEMSHLLIAGAPGSGKSICLNGLILSILYQRSPAECRFIMIDHKIGELRRYNDIPHLLTPVITEPKRAFQALQYCVFETERRYACLDSLEVRNIRSYNKRIKERGIGVDHLPYIVVVVNEFSGLLAGKAFETSLARLAAVSRTVGIHLVLTTQHSSMDVITSLIKVSIPSRIAFMVSSKLESRTLMDTAGAEKLLGKGDMLYADAGEPAPARIQGAFVSDEEIERVVEYMKTLGETDYIDEELFMDEEPASPTPAETDDPLYERAVEIVMQEGKVSAGSIQRRLKIGLNRALRLVETMERRGLISPVT
ncbi:MAG: DNA translocase FtsK [Spirochaetaceae bacterium]|jgi:S-DNA-T family DNA segregation ATPase FtsK/SpoIIIE|nr:DNA translocase FtsK [Spirochaetaceae bacterium]